MTNSARMHNAEDTGAARATENAHNAGTFDANDQAEDIEDTQSSATLPGASKPDADYIPPHLRSYVFHSQDDFYVSRYFDPVLLAHLMYEGFLPIASEFGNQCFLLPKLHRQRCILLLKSPEHVPRSIKKRGKKYKLVLNKNFDAVVAGCHAQHGIPWLYPPIVAGFRTLFDAGKEGIELFPGKRVRFYSVELLDVVTNELAAGELGYTVGKVYTSLTGFSRVNGAGTVQLHALSKLLYLSGMELWDLGMSMPYKTSLGASDEPRDVFLRHHYRWREHDCLLHLDEGEGDLSTGAHVKVIFDISRPKSVGLIPGIHCEDEDAEYEGGTKDVDQDIQDGTQRLQVGDDNN